MLCLRKCNFASQLSAVKYESGESYVTLKEFIVPFFLRPSKLTIPIKLQDDLVVIAAGITRHNA